MVIVSAGSVSLGSVALETASPFVFFSVSSPFHVLSDLHPARTVAMMNKAINNDVTFFIPVPPSVIVWISVNRCFYVRNESHCNSTGSRSRAQKFLLLTSLFQTSCKFLVACLYSIIINTLFGFSSARQYFFRRAKQVPEYAEQHTAFQDTLCQRIAGNTSNVRKRKKAWRTG